MKSFSITKWWWPKQKIGNYHTNHFIILWTNKWSRAIQNVISFMTFVCTSNWSFVGWFHFIAYKEWRIYFGLIVLFCLFVDPKIVAELDFVTYSCSVGKFCKSILCCFFVGEIEPTDHQIRIKKTKILPAKFACKWQTMHKFGKNTIYIQNSTLILSKKKTVR